VTHLVHYVDSRCQKVFHEEHEILEFKRIQGQMNTSHSTRLVNYSFFILILLDFGARNFYHAVYNLVIVNKFIRNEFLFKLNYLFIRFELKRLFFLDECLLNSSPRTIASSRLSVFLHVTCFSNTGCTFQHVWKNYSYATSDAFLFHLLLGTSYLY
jgi:hypothetical protein